MDSVEATAAALQGADTTPSPEAGFSLPENDDSALEAIWDRENVTNGADRDPGTGRFASTEAKEGPAGHPQSPVEGEGEVAEEVADPSTPDTTDVPLPSNWTGKEELWAKIPPELRSEVAELQLGFHAKLSEQGRQIAAMRQVSDVVDQHKASFSGMRHEDGRPVSSADAVSYLFNVNRQMNENPVSTILEIADRFNVRAQLGAALVGNGEAPQGANESVLLERIAGLESYIQRLTDPAMIDQRITQHLDQDRQIRDAEALISRLTQDKPLYAEIPEAAMIQFIHMARETNGGGASQEDVFNLAYDMAVNAIPALRAKAAAAKPAADASAQRKVADAKRANGVNVTSTSSGKERKLSEDEELALAFDKSIRN